MEISTSALPTVAAERATMFIADKVSQHRFGGGDVDGLLALIARKQTQAEAELWPDDPYSVLLRSRL